MSENTENKSCVVPIGPYHPLQEEPEFFKLHVDGEKVVGIDIEIGYNHRGIEKISEAKHYDQGIFAVERICGICSTSHPFAYCNAVEDLAGIELPERARYIRTLVGELERIHSHLLWLGLAGHFLGYNTVWMWSWKYREPVLDIFEKISGNRQHYSMFKIGGVRRDILAEDIPWIEKELDALIKAVEMFKGAVMDDPVILARTKNIGVLTAKDIKDYGGVGPLARASGVDIDIRRDNPYAAYNLVDWKVQTFQGGDIFAKAVVRILETLESIKIIQQCLVRLKTVTGPIDLKIKEIPAGEGIGRHRGSGKDAEYGRNRDDQGIQEIPVEGQQGEGLRVIVESPFRGQEQGGIPEYLEIGHQRGSHHPEEGKEAEQAQRGHDQRGRDIVFRRGFHDVAQSPSKNWRLPVNRKISTVRRPMKANRMTDRAEAWPIRLRWNPSLQIR